MEKNSMEAFVGTYELGHVFVFSSSCCFNWLWRLLRHLCSGMLEINLTWAFLSITCIFSMKNWNNAGALHLKFRRNLYPWTVLQARPFGYCLNFLSDTDEFGIYSFWYYHDFLSQDVNVICIGWSLCNTLRQNHEMVFVGWSLIVYSLWMKLGCSPTSIDSSIRVNRSEYLPRSAQTVLCKSKDSMLVACILNQDALYVHRMRYLSGTFEATRPNWSGICCKQHPEGIVGNLDIHQWLFRFRYKFRHDNRCTFSLRSQSDESNLRIKAFLPFFAAQNLFVSTNFLKAIIEGAAATLSLWFSVFSLQKWTLIFSWPLCL